LLDLLSLNFAVRERFEQNLRERGGCVAAVLMAGINLYHQNRRNMKSLGRVDLTRLSLNDGQFE
jgi:hypothetical protein